MITALGQFTLPLLIAVPLIAAIVCILVNNSRARHYASFAFISLQTLSAVSAYLYYSPLLIDGSLVQDSAVRTSLGGWGAPLGIDLVVDGFALIMIMLTAALGFVLSIYSIVYFGGKVKGEKFWPIWFLLLSGLNALYLSGDAFNLYVCLEIVGLASAGLIAVEQGRDALTAALRYLLVGLLGSLFYLLGVAILYRSHGTLDLTALAELSFGSASESVALMLIMSGLILKAALFPLHFWLPSAHASAPAPASAILSALVVKASLYLALRYWFDVLHVSVTEAAATLLGILSCAAIIWGSWNAFRADRLKLMVAYSTVAQLGYMFLVFALASRYIDSSSNAGLVAIQAVVYFIVAHAFAKAAMFLTAGNILLSLGHDEVSRFGGLAKSNPLAIGVFAIAGSSLIGLPPSAGFIAKWLLLNAAIESGNWLWLMCIVVGGLLATLYIFRVLIIAFDSTSIEPQATQNSDTQTPAIPVPGILSASALSLAVGAMILGVNAEPILNLVNASSLAFYFSG